MVKGFVDIAGGLIRITLTPLGWIGSAIGADCRRHPLLGVVIGIFIFAFGRSLAEKGEMYTWIKQWLLSLLH